MIRCRAGSRRVADSRLFLYGALAILLFLVWQTWEMEKAPQSVLMPSSSAPSQETPSSVSEPTPSDDMPGAVAAAPKATDVPYKPSPPAPGSPRGHVRTDVLDLYLDTRGGSVVQADLPRYPVSLNEPDDPTRLLFVEGEIYVAQSGLTHDISGERDRSHRAPSHHASYRSAQTDYDFREASQPQTVSLRWESPDGVEVIKHFRFTPGSYLVDVTHEVRNQGQEDWVGRQYRQLRRSAGREPDRTSLLFGNTEAISFRGAAYHDSQTYHKLSYEDIAEQPFSANIIGGWVAMLQHYFVSAWVPHYEDPEQYYTRVVRGDRYPEYIIGMHSPAQRIAPGDSARFEAQLYLGPKDQNTLEQIAEGLDLTVDYGVLTILAKPLFWVLDHLYAVLGNWGWAIVFLTLLIKLAFYKLSETSYRSMAKMRKFSPRIQQLRERYAGDRQKMNEAMMKMYREEKVNPLGGCWPILVQIPVFIALYWVLLESVELRQAPFIGWIADLSVRDPYYVLPVLMGASMVIQTKLNPTPPDPFQAKLMMAMPIVFTVFFLFFPAGLVLYWLVNNILSIAQQWYIIRRMEA